MNYLFNELIPKIIRHLKAGFRRIYVPIGFMCSKMVPDKIYIKYKYKRITGQKLNLDKPETFNEKINWMKLYDRNPLYSKLADKYEVREYVSERIGGKYLIPLIGIWNTAEEIDYESFPNAFVLKCTHDSGSVIICKDISEFDVESAKRRLSKALSTNYYDYSREWVYKDIKPRVIAEYYLGKESKDVLDYKFFCFDGKPFIIQVDFGRFTNHKRNIYDLNWNYLDLSIEYPNDSTVKIEKPASLQEMIECAKKLAAGLRFVRVDLYYIDGRIYFGEMTFYHGSGFEKFMPEEYNYVLGKLIKI